MEYDYDDSSLLCADHGGVACSFYECPVYIQCLRIQAKERKEREEWEKLQYQFAAKERKHQK